MYSMFLSKFFDKKNILRSSFCYFNIRAGVWLLTILKPLTTLLPCVCQMFDNVGSLRMGFNHINRMAITAMVSCEQEIMELRNTQYGEGKVEAWMSTVLTEMRVTNRYITKKAIFDYGKVRRPR